MSITVKNLIKNCDEISCMKKLIFLYNPKTKAMVPTDYDSLSSDEKAMIEVMQKSKGKFVADLIICYNGAHHRSHFTTCTKPNLFSGKGKK